MAKSTSFGGTCSYVASSRQSNKRMLVVDDIIRVKASELDQLHTVAYPRTEKGLLDFDLLTSKDLDRYTDIAVKQLIACDVSPLNEPSHESVVGLIGLSDLEFMINMMALSRLGYAVFILSPRLSIHAYEHLLESANCGSICFAQSLETLAFKMSQRRDLALIPMIKREDFQRRVPDALTFELPVDREKRKHEIAYIMHSSGSTGLPKPIYQTHQACIQNYMQGHGLNTLLAAPLYHTHGHACLFRSIYKSCTIYFLNANLPPSSSNLIRIMEAMKPEAVNAVPYILKLLAESERGIQALRTCTLVSSAGSAMSDELGDRLVSNGVHLVSLWGATEVGAIMNSMRPFEDKDWSYLSIIPSAQPSVWMKPVDESTYELVALDGLKSKVISNSNDPPKSFHTRDMFAPHPSKRGRWKYIGRMDDRVTLSNGEKVLPLSIEGRIRGEKLVREAVVFGMDRPFPGLLLFRSDHAASMDDSTFISNVLPTINEVNARAEAFSQLMTNAIVPIGSQVDYPRTDKGNFIRAKVYKTFSKEIQAVYDASDNSSEGTLELSQSELESFILRSFEEKCSVLLPSVDADFFACGLDSFLAIKIVTFLKQELNLGGNGHSFSTDTIFEKANAMHLAHYLLQLRLGKDIDRNEDMPRVMAEMIREYSSFHSRGPAIQTIESRAILLTGATGCLGAHVLAHIISGDPSARVYCLVRASSDSEARLRVLASAEVWGLDVPVKTAERIVCLSSDLSRQDLGLTHESIYDIRRNIDLIIHSAWSVNFNLSLGSFEEQHVKGTYNLLNLALSTHGAKPARFLFCSSISVAAKSSLSLIPEALISDLRLAGGMGYAQSKMVSEHIVARAAKYTNLDARILRIGQIVGSSHSGIWNDTELIPLIVRSSLTLGCLPELQETCSWLPVDTVAETLVRIGHNDTLARSTMNVDMHSIANSAKFYNIVNPSRFSWTEEFLPALRKAGLSFECVSTEIWMRRLQDTVQDPMRNPVIKLLPTLRKRYGKQTWTEAEPVESEETLLFATDNAQTASPIINSASNVVSPEAVKLFVDNWLKKWGMGDKET